MKDKENKLRLTTKAAEITDGILEKTLPYLTSGISEKAIAEIIVALTKKAGCKLSFPPVVAFGRWSAYPHHKPIRRKLRKNDLVLIDLGAKYKGYCADLTRMFTFGKLKSDQEKLLRIVLAAQKYMMKIIRPGMGYREADVLVRKYFQTRGVEPKLIRHGLGHGIGRQVHTGFVLSVKAKSDGKLKTGDIFTIEPGLYIKGVGGVRIEDTVLLTKNGIKPLTKFPKY
ncbi:MAG: M24 family metallopeptidase [Patescibacteria group bacterium]